MSVFELVLTGCGVIMFAAAFMESRKFIKNGKRIAHVSIGDNSTGITDTSSDESGSDGLRAQCDITHPFYSTYNNLR